jgi:hypothetical protein
MGDSRQRYYRGLFATAAIYDVVLGVVFLFFGRWAFDILDIEEKYPEGGFIQLIGAFVLVLGIAYYLIWRSDLWRNRDLVAIGALYKLAYTGVGLWVAVFDELPHLVFLWAFGIADAVFLVLMVECLVYLYKQHRPLTEAADGERGTAVFG